MKIKYILKILIILLLPSAVFSETGEIINMEEITIPGKSLPVFYPEGTIGNVRPYIIWYDKYLERDKTDRAKYRITLSRDDNVIDPILIHPDCYENHYFYLFPVVLKPGEYTYMIERLLNNKPVNSAYFHYLKYPVTGYFKLEPGENKSYDLPPEYLIRYISGEKNNRLVNGYNALFYGGAGVGAFGIGMLFYSVFDFGLISRIISYISFASSAAGIGAAGYYGYHYYQEKNQLLKLLETGKKVSIYGNATNKIISADIRLSF